MMSSEPLIQQLAQKYGFSQDAIRVLLTALQQGQGRMAQFNHPELGGQGQWMPGMVMIGNLFDHALKARVDAVCTELSGAIATGQIASTPGSTGEMGMSWSSQSPPTSWWPITLGLPDQVGSQNSVSYAIFTHKRRLAIRFEGITTVFDLGDHRITSISQQQASGWQGITLASQYGFIRVIDLPVVTEKSP